MHRPLPQKNSVQDKSTIKRAIIFFFIVYTISGNEFKECSRKFISTRALKKKKQISTEHRTEPFIDPKYYFHYTLKIFKRPIYHTYIRI